MEILRDKSSKFKFGGISGNGDEWFGEVWVDKSNCICKKLFHLVKLGLAFVCPLEGEILLHCGNNCL